MSVQDASRIGQRFVGFGTAMDRMTAIGRATRSYEDRAARLWLFSSIVWLAIADMAGMVLATEFAGPNAFGGISWLEFGRVRPVHVNGVILLWTSMAFWGAIFYMLPRLLGTRSMWHERWLIWIGWLYNIFGVLVVVSIPLGFTTGREYWEPIWPLKVIFEICLVVNIFSVLMTIQMRVVRPLYVTVWWSVAAPMWLAADYFIGGIMWSPGNFWGNQIPWGVGKPLPQSALSSSLADGLLEWWGAHNIFGLWLTPMFIAVAYYMVPRITNTPLYSHTLSLISFWGMAFFYTGVGHHHLLQTPTPGWLKSIATMSSMLLLLPVFAFGINILQTMRGNWDKFFTNLPLRFALTGFIFYILVNIQGSYEAIQPFNKMTHFTNFVVAHAHLAILGAFTFICMGFIDYAIPQIYRKPIWSWGLTLWQYWLITIGFTMFFTALTVAGFFQGQMWNAGIPEINVLPLLHPWFIVRAIAGALIVISGFIQAFNIWMTVRTDTRARTRSAVARHLQPIDQPVSPSLMETQR